MYVVTEVYHQPFVRQYGTMAYESVLTFSKVDILPRTNFELGALTFIILISAIINANLFGVVATLVEALQRRSAALADEIDNA